MNLNFSKEEIAFRDDARAFLRDHLPADLRHKVADRRHLTKDDTVRWQRILNARGWATPSWPVEHGGQGWSPTQRFLFQQEMALGCAPEGSPFNINMIGPILCRYGTAAQQEKFLAATASLDIWWCQGFSEPNAGSDLASLTTRAVRDGDDYVVSGQKIWTTQAQHADWMFALVRTDAAGRKQAGISFLLIDMRSPGVSVRPIETIDGQRDLNEVFLDNVRVPAENLVGEENKGWDYAKFLLGHERSGIARIGLSKERMARIKSLLSSLGESGELTVSEQRRFQRKLAALEVELKALEITQLRVVSADSLGGSANAAASVLKIKGTEVQQAMTELVLELAGPRGLTVDGAHDEAPAWSADSWIDVAASYYFTMRKVSIFGGSNEIQKNIVARSILGL